MEFNKIIIEFFKAKYEDKDLTFTDYCAKVCESKIDIKFNNVDIDDEIAELPGSYSTAEIKKIFAEIESVYGILKKIS